MLSNAPQQWPDISAVFNPVEAVSVGKTFTEFSFDEPHAAPSSKAVEDDAVSSRAPTFLMTSPGLVS
jgi:hypothetical protein